MKVARHTILIVMKSFAFFSLLFLAISCSSPSADMGTLATTAIRPPIEEFAVAEERTAWVITDREELVRISDQRSDVLEFPGKPQTLFFLNKNKGWVFASDSSLWATTDGGQNWSLKSSLTDIGPTISELRFVDANNGWLVNWFAVLTTTDGGATWTMVYPTDELNYRTLGARPANISVPTKETAWVAMTNGIVLNTNDGGRTWQTFWPGANRHDFQAIHANGKGEVWVGAAAGPQTGLYYTSNNGVDWAQVLDKDTVGKLRGLSISFATPKDGWVFASGCAEHPNDPHPIEGIVYKTTNGRDWTRMSGETFRIAFDEVKFTDPLNGWLLGYNHREGHSYIYKTIDGGANWGLVYELRRPRV